MTKNKVFYQALEHVIALVPTILARWDIGEQRTKLYEEVGELLTEVARYRQDRSTIEKVIEECADVIICVLQMAAWHSNVNSAWLKILGEMIQRKSKRLETKVLMPVNEPVATGTASLDVLNEAK